MWRIAGVVILGMIMSILDTTIVNVALHTLGLDLHSSIAQIQWVVTGYLLALAAVIPVTGWAARRFGAKRVYMTSLVLFTVGSALCAVGLHDAALVLFRVLQGAGGGMIMPLGQLIMAQVAGPQRMGRVMAVVSMPAMLAPILGPVAGGVILANLHWSWIFLVNVPGRRAGVHPGLADPPPHRVRRGRAAWTCVGLVLLSIASSATVYGLSELGTRSDLASPHVLIPMVVGLLCTGAFILHALRIPRPLLDVRLYANRIFAAASLTTFALGAALFGAMILVPLYYQEVRHESVIITGLLVGPQGLGMLMVMPFTGRLAERLGNGRLALVGVSILVLSTVPLGFIGAHTSVAVISTILVVRGVGHRLRLRARDVGRLRLDAPRSALRRHPPAERPAADRRVRSASPCWRSCCSGASGHASDGHEARLGLRRRLLVVAGDRGPGADPVHRAAARRAPAVGAVGAAAAEGVEPLGV